MKSKIKWADRYDIVIKVIDTSVYYSYSYPDDPTDHKCYDHIEITGEIVYSDYKSMKKGQELKLLSIVNHDDEIKGLDDKVWFEEKGITCSMTLKEYREKNRKYNVVGHISRHHISLTTDDRFWDRYSLIKILNKDIYIPMDCRREKYDRGLKIIYYGMSDKFDITDYE